MKIRCICPVQPSVDVVYIHRYAGLNSPCKWFIVIGIFIYLLDFPTPQTRMTDQRLTGDNKNFNIAAIINGDLDGMIDARPWADG